MSNRRFFLATASLAAMASRVCLGGGGAFDEEHQVRLEKGDLKATIGDNSQAFEHRPGYNGIWELLHRSASRSIFVPGIAGLNLEHLVTGSALDTDDKFFEPRRSSMQIREINAGQVQLYQAATPYTHVESWTTFQVVSDEYLDMHFRCRVHQGPFPYGYLALFWASYINAPEDKSMYFLGTPDGKTEQWLQLCTQSHNDQSTVRHRDDMFEMSFADDGRAALFKSLSPLRYSTPMFYGHFEDLMWGMMFDRTSGIRFTHSPSGGGFNQERRTSNPAWDFQYVIEKPEIEREYGFHARSFLIPRCSRTELLERYFKWREQ